MRSAAAAELKLRQKLAGYVVMNDLASDCALWIALEQSDRCDFWCRFGTCRPPPFASTAIRLARGEFNWR